MQLVTNLENHQIGLSTNWSSPLLAAVLEDRFSRSQGHDTCASRANYLWARSARRVNKGVHFGALVGTEHTSDASGEASSCVSMQNAPAKPKRDRRFERSQQNYDITLQLF
jgi:hypothetical protein